MGFNGDLAQQQFCEAHVRFGSKADIAAPPINVRFTPQKRTLVERVVECPLCAKSGHCRSH